MPPCEEACISPSLCPLTLPDQKVSTEYPLRIKNISHKYPALLVSWGFQKAQPYEYPPLQHLPPIKKWRNTGTSRRGKPDELLLPISKIF